MTLPASGQLSLADIFEELFGIPHTTQQTTLQELYDFSTLTPKSTDIAISDFYGYIEHNFTGWDPASDANITEPASSFVRTVRAQGYGWTVQSKPSWVSSLVPNSVADAAELLDEDVTVNYDENLGGPDRSDDIVLIQNTTSLTSTLTINQDGNEIDVDPTTDQVSWEADTYTDITDLSASDDWTVISKPAWVTAVSPSSGGATGSQLIDFTVTENTTGSPRGGDIVFELDNFPLIEVAFTLNQMAAPE